METIKLFSNSDEFNVAFKRCCDEYSKVEIFTAWVGNPGNILPYSHLENLTTVKVFLGISFDQSHPDGIEYLMNKKYSVVIVNDKNTYHPKLYFFSSKNKFALLMGSSNFTYSGFYQNMEANVLLEGRDLQVKIKAYLNEIKLKLKDSHSFIPTQAWLKEYRKKYAARLLKLEECNIKEETLKEDKQVYSSSWLGTADWQTYVKHIRIGMLNHTDAIDETHTKKIARFSEYKINLKIPWNVSTFGTIENRRRILGIRPYGWLGHIGASGRIQQLLSNGNPREKRIIIDAINKIAKMELPLNYSSIGKELQKLEDLGPTMKVWGRMLAITRPDIYCTISSPSVRASLSELLDKPQSHFGTIDGYIDLLKLIHQAPWYKSERPKEKKDSQLWENKVAFLDVIFY